MPYDEDVGYYDEVEEDYTLDELTDDKNIYTCNACGGFNCITFLDFEPPLGCLYPLKGRECYWRILRRA
jgi:hypothetical protein